MQLTYICLIPLNNGTASQRSSMFLPEKYPKDKKRNNNGNPNSHISKNQMRINAPKCQT